MPDTSLLPASSHLQGVANQIALAANPNIGMSPHKIFMIYYDPDIDGLDYEGFAQVCALAALMHSSLILGL